MASSRITTGFARVSYCNLTTPKKMGDDQQGKYGCALLIPKTDTETKKKIDAAIEQARLDGAGTFGGKAPAKVKSTLYDGDDGDHGKECEGMWVLNCSSGKAVRVVDRRMQDIIDPTEVYSGMWIRADLLFKAYNTGTNKGIACYINNAQKVKDDQPFGGVSRAEDAFEALDDDDDLGI